MVVEWSEWSGEPSRLFFFPFGEHFWSFFSLCFSLREKASERGRDRIGSSLLSSSLSSISYLPDMKCFVGACTFTRTPTSTPSPIPPSPFPSIHLTSSHIFYNPHFLLSPLKSLPPPSLNPHLPSPNPKSPLPPPSIPPNINSSPSTPHASGPGKAIPSTLKPLQSISSKLLLAAVEGGMLKFIECSERSRDEELVMEGGLVAGGGCVSLC